MAEQLAHTQLMRSRNGHVGGVCAGIAEWLDFDPIVIRILTILLTINTLGIAGLVYLALWAYLPKEPESKAPYEVRPESAESTAYGSLDCDNLDEYLDPSFSEESTKLALVPRLAVAVALMLLFLIVVMWLSPIVPGAQWWQFWPLGLLIVGLCLIVIPVRTRFESTWHAAGIAITSIAAMMIPISLGIFSWETIPYAFSRLWMLFVAAAILYVIGVRRDSGMMVVIAALCITLFCLIALLSYALPGVIRSLFIVLPGGTEFHLIFLNG